MESRQSVDPRMPSAECSAPPFADSACDLVTVPTRQGLEAVDILRRGACDGVGPVLHDDGDDTLGFLVPPGTAAAWDLPGSTCTETNGRGCGSPPTPSPLSRVPTGCFRLAMPILLPTPRCCVLRWVRRLG